jgi:hypothetical protein
MRNKIFGGIGILWGGAVLANWFISGIPNSGGAYQTGQFTGLLFGALMLGAGLYAFLKKTDKKAEPNSIDKNA